jgi:CheY-like chemotaxis protein
MDCDMPIMNGFEATRIILKKNRKDDLVPNIVAVTGDSTEQN